MTPCERILEAYCVAARNSRHSPNILIVNPNFELRVQAEMIQNSAALNIYNGIKIIHSEDIEEFQLVFAYEHQN
jgi:hypothetical protein